MKSQILGLRVAGTVFGLMSLVQLARCILRAEVLVAGYNLPLWPSALAFLLLGGLCLWLWKLSRDALANKKFPISFISKRRGDRAVHYKHFIRILLYAIFLSPLCVLADERAPAALGAENNIQSIRASRPGITADEQSTSTIESNSSTTAQATTTEPTTTSIQPDSTTSLLPATSAIEPTTTTTEQATTIGQTTTSMQPAPTTSQQSTTTSIRAVGDPCIFNEQCGEYGFCERVLGDCSGLGACRIIPPSGCAGVWQPVCGCDGKTYSNSGCAIAERVNVAYEGKCGKPGVTTSFYIPPNYSSTTSTSIQPTTSAPTSLPAISTSSVVSSTTTSRPVSPTTSSAQTTTTLQPVTTTSTAAVCPASLAAGGEAVKLAALREFRNRVLMNSAMGREYVFQFYLHSLELSSLMIMHPPLTAQSRDVLNAIMPALRRALSGGEVSLTATQAEQVILLLDAFDRESGPELHAALQSIKAELLSGAFLKGQD